MPETLLDRLISENNPKSKKKTRNEEILAEIAEKVNIVRAKLKEANMNSLSFEFQIPNSLFNTWHDVSISVSDTQTSILFNNLLVYKNGVIGDDAEKVFYALNELLSHK